MPDLDLFTDLNDENSEQILGGNWGTLTSTAIANGFDQGAHASSFAGEPRQGLGNLNKDLAAAGFGSKKGLDALTNFIASQQ